jgi:hypothetical protein
MASEAEELRKIRKRIDAMNPPSVGCGVFFGLWLFLCSLLVLRGCFGVDALGPLRSPPAPTPAEFPATSAERPAAPAGTPDAGLDPGP